MMPMPTMQVTKDEPPRLMKGKTIPVNGMVPVTTAMLIRAWNVIQQVMPTANRPPNESGASFAIRNPR